MFRSTLSNSVSVWFHPLKNFKANLSIKRPLSPHLTIYRLPLPSILSISHRVSGVGLGFIVYGLGLYSAFNSIDVMKSSEWIQNNVHPVILRGMKFIIALPLTFHISNGVRHLIWDLGFFLSLKGVYLTGYTVLATTISTAAMLAAQ